MNTATIYNMMDTSEGKIPLDLSMQLPEGKIIALYGPSGAGKTTFLKIIAGLVLPTNGYIEMNGNIWLDTKNNIFLPTHKRNLSMVFQDYVLFPNMTVLQNLEYALKGTISKSLINDMMEQLELTALKHKYPSTLSGGQKQRVALGRALLRQPKLLLLDEPFSAIDYSLKTKLHDLIARETTKHNITTVLVSHDLPDIYRLAQIVYVMEKGNVTKQGTPNEVFTDRNISSKFQFIGTVFNIEKEDLVYVINVLISDNMVKVIGTENDIIGLKTGDKVMVATKAFNPIIRKIVS